MKRLEIGDERLEIEDKNLVGTEPAGSIADGQNLLTLPMAHRLPKRDVFNTVLTGVAKTFADMNVKDISEHDRDYLVNELTDNIIKHYPAIRLPEITLALWLGVRGTFGEFFGLSVVTFERFIHAYLLSEKRVQLVRELPGPEEKTVPDMETQFATAKHNALQALQRKKDGKETSAIAPTVYNFLNGLQLIHFTKAEKYDMLADAVRELIGELKLKLIVAPRVERTGLKADIQAYKDALIQHASLNQQQYTQAIMRSKKLALDAFFNNLMMDDGDLEALIESNRDLFFDTKK